MDMDAFLGISWVAVTLCGCMLVGSLICFMSESAGGGLASGWTCCVGACYWVNLLCGCVLWSTLAGSLESAGGGLARGGLAVWVLASDRCGTA
jgi:hypothetical protein